MLLVHLTSMHPAWKRLLGGAAPAAGTALATPHHSLRQGAAPCVAVLQLTRSSLSTHFVALDSGKPAVRSYQAVFNVRFVDMPRATNAYVIPELGFVQGFSTSLTPNWTRVWHRCTVTSATGAPGQVSMMPLAGRLAGPWWQLCRVDAAI